MGGRGSGRHRRGSGKDKPANSMAAYMRARRAETTAARKAATDALTRASHHPVENFFWAAACLIQRCKRRIEHQLGRRKRDRGAVRCQPDERRHSRLQRHGSCPGAAPFSSCAQELALQTPNLSNGERMIRRANEVGGNVVQTNADGSCQFSVVAISCTPALAHVVRQLGKAPR